MRSKISIAIDNYEAQIAALELEAAGLRKVVETLRATQVATMRKSKATPGPLLTESQK